jgi:threonine dehydratase
MALSFEQIQATAAALAGQVVRTPCLRSAHLSEAVGGEVFLKLENLQLTGSFKARGALAKLLSLSPAERARGVAAMSAGNHALGLAFHARRLGVPVTVVMPRFTPAAKLEPVRRLGAEVLLHGETLDEARSVAEELARERGRTLVHPYDDPQVVAGQGTLALELLEQRLELDALIVPVGGGGLIAGCAIAASELRPGIEILGVQTARFPSMQQALAGQPVACGRSTLAEGVAVKRPGELALAVVRERVAGIWLVEEDEIESAIALLLEQERLLVEGAGAVGVAALLARRELFAGRRVAVVVSGGNLDLSVLASILQRRLARSGRWLRLCLDLRDAPGELAKATALISDAGASIVDIHHQRAFGDLALESVEVEFVLQVRSPEDAGPLLRSLREAGYHAWLPDPLPGAPARSAAGSERTP